MWTGGWRSSDTAARGAVLADAVDRIEIVLAHQRDVPRARMVASRAMDAIGATQLQRTRFVTAVSELARNTVVHGGGGTVCVETVYRRGERAISAIFTDVGPGIADIDQALSDGFTSGGGLGLGLGGARRLVDDFSLESRPGHGATVRICSGGG